MTTRKLVRRVFFSAAVSTASFFAAADADVFGWESTSSGIQRAQYQPGQAPQNAAQSNAAVTAELKRMFEESGQTMPSMHPAQLPNAQGQQMNRVRPTQRPNSQHTNLHAAAPHNGVQQAGMQQTGIQQNGIRQQPKQQAPAKQNFLKRFIGKVSGQERKAAEAAVVPPVPPGFREPAPAPPVDTPNVTQSRPMAQPAQGQQSMINARPAGMSSTANGQSRVNATPASGSQIRQNNSSPVRQTPGAVAPVRTAQATQSTVPAQTVSQPTQPVPDIPVGAGSAVRSKNASVQQPSHRVPQSVQPGTAPSFMPAATVNSVATRPAPDPQPKTQPTKSGPPDDGLENLFDDAASSDDSGELLDLDAISVQPGADIPQPVNPLPSTAEAAATPSSGGTSETNATATGNNVDPSSDIDDQEVNPFTGVRLNESNDEDFDPSLSSASTQSQSSSEPGRSTESESFEDFATSAHDSEQGLPAISLPAVEDLQSSEEDSVAVPADLGFPELDAADRAEGGFNQAATPSSESRRKDLPDNVEAAAKPLRSLDAEKLQQVAEQERLQRQRRQIQSRAGQAGFKGFCPVELRDRRELVDTNPEFTATFGLQTYTFSSAAARTAFEADPSRYAPAAGGSDVVLLVNSGEEQPGMLDYALWYRDRLYLFRSRETMALFNQDPLRFANQY